MRDGLLSDREGSHVTDILTILASLQVGGVVWKMCDLPFDRLQSAPKAAPKAGLEYCIKTMPIKLPTTLKASGSRSHIVQACSMAKLYPAVYLTNVGVEESV